MQYFNTLPLVVQNIYNNYQNNQVVTNLLSRAYLIPSLLNNVMMFYEYDIKEDETPESIAYNYYDDVYKYWLILYSNNIFDIQSDWPKTSSQFTLYLEDKYKEDANGNPVIAYTMSTIHHYEKTIATSDNLDFQEKTVTIQITEDDYNSLIPSTTNRTFNSGTVVTQTITKQAVSIYNYESELNEDKRKVKILRTEFVDPMEKKFRQLMQT